LNKHDIVNRLYEQHNKKELRIANKRKSLEREAFTKMSQKPKMNKNSKQMLGPQQKLNIDQRFHLNQISHETKMENLLLD
jgi:hypothetical protein